MTINVAENVRMMIENGLAETEEFALELLDAMIAALADGGMDVIVEL